MTTQLRNLKTPTFQRRHYEALATLLGDAYRTANETQVKGLIWIEANVQQMLEKDNPAFDAERFIKAVKIAALKGAD